MGHENPNFTVAYDSFVPGVLTELPSTPSQLISPELEDAYEAARVDFYRTVLAGGESGDSDSGSGDEVVRDPTCAILS